MNENGNNCDPLITSSEKVVLYFSCSQKSNKDRKDNFKKSKIFLLETLIKNFDVVTILFPVLCPRVSNQLSSSVKNMSQSKRHLCGVSNVYLPPPLHLCCPPSDLHHLSLGSL